MTPLMVTFLYQDYLVNGSKEEQLAFFYFSLLGIIFDMVFSIDFIKNFFATYIDDEN